MKEGSEWTLVHKGEVEDRIENIRLLEQLSGYARLTEKQKQFILLSLYIQQRAERGTDTGSSARIQAVPEGFTENAPGGVYITHPKTVDMSESWERYKLSQLNVMSNYCHETARKLESYGAGKKPEESTWYDAGTIKSFSDLEQLIDLAEHDIASPFLLEMWNGEPDDPKREQVVHTTVLLGKNGTGDWMCWEKSGFHLPYQIITLSVLYDAYKEHTGWRLRTLAT